MVGVFEGGRLVEFGRRELVSERALQIAADVGRWCSGFVSGVVGGVDR